MFAQTRTLLADAVNKPWALGIRSIVFRLVADEFNVQIHIHRMPRNAQVHEMRAQKADPRDIADQRVFGRDLCNDAVRGNDIQVVQPLDNRGGQRVPAVAGLFVFKIAADLSVRAVSTGSTDSAENSVACWQDSRRPHGSHKRGA